LRVYLGFRRWLTARITPVAIYLKQLQLAGPDDGLGAIAHVQLAVDVGGVRLHGSQAEEKSVSDFLIGKSFGKQPQDFQFPFAEGIEQALIIPSSRDGKNSCFTRFDLIFPARWELIGGGQALSFFQGCPGFGRLPFEVFYLGQS
jgi:hypothetical protein